MVAQRFVAAHAVAVDVAVVAAVVDVAVAVEAVVDVAVAVAVEDDNSALAEKLAVLADTSVVVDNAAESRAIPPWMAVEDGVAPSWEEDRAVEQKPEGKEKNMRFPSLQKKAQMQREAWAVLEEPHKPHTPSTRCASAFASVLRNHLGHT